MPLKTSWRTKWRILLAKILIRLRKLTHSDYTVDELNEILAGHFPTDMPVTIPAGKGKLTLLHGELKLPKNQPYIHVEMLSSFEVESVGNPIYRAHLTVALRALPTYLPATETVRLAELHVDSIRLVNDEYALIKDTQQLLSMFVPRPLQSLVTGSVKSAMGLLTGGTSDAAIAYLQLYLTGSKQRILDYHRPQLTTLVSELIEDDELQYQMDRSDWQEYLFACYGKSVVVEDGLLRFKF